MKSLTISLLVVLGFSGCTSSDISTLSKKECTKQGFSYKMKKRFNFRTGEYEIESICFQNIKSA